ncbi:efflux RND transporter periplasmic adaptor subunit [Amaricoccus sp. W119]|uniref:efflux RND transporter periplasmic adaptor subunit n=1 Tax=Amaricoccus sp. W119 TaxID=3391833 RepID=UPI0039A74231
MTAKHIPIAVATLAFSLAWVPLAIAQDAPPPLVRLVTVGQEDPAMERTFFGRTVARQTVDLGFQVDGQLVDFPVAEGALIPEGDLLARLDQKPFMLAVEQARLQEQQARREASRAEQLGGNISVAQREALQTEAALAQVSRENAELALERSTLAAPFDAVVSIRTVANFTTVATGQPVVRLHDMSELRVEIDVPEQVVRQAGLDPRYDLFARFGGDDALYPIEIVETDIETGPVSGTYTVTLGMEPPEDALILPGYSVAVVMRRGQSAEGSDMVVPLDAVATTPEGAYFALRYEPAGEEAGVLARVPVTVGVTDRGQIKVTEGLEPGDEIVSAGLAALSDGQAVRRFKGFEQ